MLLYFYKAALRKWPNTKKNNQIEDNPHSNKKSSYISYVKSQLSPKFLDYAKLY